MRAWIVLRRLASSERYAETNVLPTSGQIEAKVSADLLMLASIKSPTMAMESGRKLLPMNVQQAIMQNSAPCNALLAPKVITVLILRSLPRSAHRVSTLPRPDIADA